MTALFVDLLRAFEEIGERTGNDGLRRLVREELRNVSCCFTGHRPEKCRRTEADIKIDLEASIRKAIDDGYQIFINGAQRGADLWAAETVMKLIEEGAEISLVTAIPFEGFEKEFSPEWITRLKTVMDHSDKVHYVSTIRNVQGFLLRDHWMVDHSGRIIAVFNGTKGGTASTIEYAKSHGRDVEILPG